MEKALQITDVRQIRRGDGYDRVYFGAEFCQNLIPGLDELKRVCAAAAVKNKQLTLMTPYVTNEGIDRLRVLFDYLNGAGRATEVVVNDWGVYALIGKDYGNLAPVIGRLLTKQRRDPLSYDILYNRQEPLQLRDKDGGTLLCYPRRCPEAVLAHYRASLIDVPVFREYLRARGVRRVEVDDLLWDMKIRADGKMRVSVHVPFGYVSTTRFCGVVNLTYGPCRKECRSRFIALRDRRSPVPLFIRGNSVFYKSKMRAPGYWAERGIDRIVVQQA